MLSNLTNLEIASMLDSLDIELAGHCNANCLYCPRDSITREKTFMSPKVFQTLLSEIAEIYPDGPAKVYFCGLGEPLLNRHFCEFAELITDVFPDTLLTVVSNGGALTKDICDAMLSGGTFAFTCSIPSIHKEQYEATIRGGQFDLVMHWMTYLAEKKRETGLQVTVTYVKTTQTHEELREYYDFWQSKDIQVGENQLHSRGGFSTGTAIP